MATRTINGNNLNNTIYVSDYNAIPGTGYTVSGESFMTPAGPAPFIDDVLVINTLNATLGTDSVNLSLLTTNSGVFFTSITINGGGGSQIVTGSGFAETISTFAGNDTINSGAGDDTLTGGDGADSMDGGDGSDLYNIAGGQLGGDTFNDTGTSGSDTINVTGALSTFLSFGKFGKNYNDINTNLPLSALATYKGIEIFDGNNFSISGVNNGSDIFDLSGFSSATQVGAINTFDATGGTDYVNVSTADAGVTITGGGGSQIVVGSDFADTISTGGGNDSITGGAGYDSLFGGAGDDTFFANLNEAEFDELHGGLGVDTLQRATTGGQSELVLNQFLATNGIERVDLGTDFGIDGNGNDNVLDFSATTFFSSRNVEGGGGNDTIIATNSAISTYDGNSGDDVLKGGSVADNLIGSNGNDTLTGGGGNDCFYFNTALNAFTNLDTITDFKIGGDADRIYLSNTIFTGLAAGMLQAADFGTGAVAGTDVVYSGGGLYFKDGGAANLASYIKFATLTGSPMVSHTDIFVFEP
jgi:Ca2+-binding RTX toxin-like protein